MPPIFVDGTEIKQVFVDGVEQDAVFVDGVEVFSPGPDGEPMFDDFERSANGTLLTDHIMNTGQSYLYGSLDRGSTIQTQQGQQTATYTNPVNGNAETHLLPQPEEQSPAFEATMEWGTRLPNSSLRRFHITCTESTPTNRVVAVFESGAFSDPLGALFIQIGDLQDRFGQVGFNGINDDRGVLTCWYDRDFAQAKLVIGAGTFFSEKVAIPLQPRLDEIYVLDGLPLNPNSRAIIKSYSLTPYLPEDVPFP